MKFSKTLPKVISAIAVVGALGYAYAQTNNPPVVGSDPSSTTNSNSASGTRPMTPDGTMGATTTDGTTVMGAERVAQADRN